jgi:hypothetical protein
MVKKPVTRGAKTKPVKPVQLDPNADVDSVASHDSATSKPGMAAGDDDPNHETNSVASNGSAQSSASRRSYAAVAAARAVPARASVAKAAPARALSQPASSSVPTALSVAQAPVEASVAQTPVVAPVPVQTSAEAPVPAPALVPAPTPVPAPASAEATAPARVESHGVGYDELFTQEDEAKLSQAPGAGDSPAFELRPHRATDRVHVVRISEEQWANLSLQDQDVILRFEESFEENESGACQYARGPCAVSAALGSRRARAQRRRWQTRRAREV